MRFFPIFTTTLLLANGAVFALMTAADPSMDWSAGFLIAWGANYAPRTLGGEPWRLLTATFVHLGFLHIAGNMAALFFWGRPVERAMGNLGFLIAYVACGVLASYASASINPGTVSAGASGSIAGLFGMMVVMRLKGDHTISTGDLLANLAINVYLSTSAGVDWVAHAGGFAGGLALGAFLLPSGDQRQIEA